MLVVLVVNPFPGDSHMYGSPVPIGTMGTPMQVSRQRWWKSSILVGQWTLVA